MSPDSLARLLNGVTAPAPAHSRVVSLYSAKAPCKLCNVRGHCLAISLDDEAMAALDAAFGEPVKLARRETLYRAGEPAATLYAIRVGSLKTVALGEDGREQITGCHLSGDVVGLDGLGHAVHASEAVALEDSEVCALPYDKLDRLASRDPGMRRNVMALVARELRRAQGTIVLLGGLSGEERLVTFLLGLAQRYHARGFSESELMLRMTREEIASYLGLKLETVSRLFSRLHAEGLIQVQGREVKLLDIGALRGVVGLAG